MADDPEDFSAAPPTVTEVRGARSGLARDWMPRDALIHTLRRIDSGEIAPDVLLVVYRDAKDPSAGVCFHQVAKDPLLVHGLLAGMIANL